MNTEKRMTEPVGKREPRFARILGNLQKLQEVSALISTKAAAIESALVGSGPQGETEDSPDAAPTFVDHADIAIRAIQANLKEVEESLARIQEEAPPHPSVR